VAVNLHSHGIPILGDRRGEDVSAAAALMAELALEGCAVVVGQLAEVAHRCVLAAVAVNGGQGDEVLAAVLQGNVKGSLANALLHGNGLGVLLVAVPVGQLGLDALIVVGGIVPGHGHSVVAAGGQDVGNLLAG